MSSVGVLRTGEHGNLDDLVERVPSWCHLLHYNACVDVKHLLASTMILICDDCAYLGYVCKTIVSSEL